MPLKLKTSLSKKPNVIIIPFEKNKEDHALIKDLSGLSYVPEINLNAKETMAIFHPEKNQKIILLCLGEAKDKPKTHLYFRSIVHQLKSKSDLVADVIVTHLSDDDVVNAIIGLRLSLVNIGMFKTGNHKTAEPDITLVHSKEQKSAVEKGLQIAETQINVMHLVDMPSNIKTPEYMADYAVKSGKEHGFKVTIFDKKKLKEKKMDAIMAVGQGSPNEPVMIIMEYKPKGKKSDRPQLGLVGKGISFDTGGISIKPATNMGYMKCDMAGGAAVIGAVELAARLQLDVHLVGIVPAAENSVDGLAYRPGDVIGSYSGKSIEVINTDAEGRLVLADGLAYMVDKYNPEKLIDLATLTGSVIQALGYLTAGIFTHNDEMAAQLIQAGTHVNENLWRMPLWEEYAVEMNSDIADIKNLSAKPIAGSITAAKFLEAFVAEHPNWVHLDIAGVAFTDSEFAKSRIANAFGVRLLVNYMEHFIAKS